ncbi:MAG TPA: diphthine synthase, partial [Thermoplasmataceae archaeon]|nr:diphthine synthase [Thermoplasmataceae archaeon]
SEKDIIDESRDTKVCLLVTGDPLSATTHNQLRLDAMKAGVEVRIFENSSIISVIPGVFGLMHYRFGPPVSIPFVSRSFFPTSVYDKIEKNISMDLHTLLLLDLKDGKTMPVQEAVRILEELERRRKGRILEPERDICVAIAVSQPGQRLVFGTMGSIKKSGVEGNPAALVLPSTLNDSEETFLNEFAERL